MVYINPFGGFSNMIRVMLSVYYLCRIADEEVSLYWDRHNTMSYIPLSYDSIFSDRLMDIVYSLPSDAVVYDEIPSIDTVDMLKSMIGGNNDIVIRSCGISIMTLPYDYNYNFSLLHFRDEYMIKASNIISSGVDLFIGIHIRRGDFTGSSNMTPIQFFIDSMNKEILLNSNVIFFLATDDNNTERDIISMFPGRVVVYKKTSYIRSDANYLKSGIIDMLCLSRCSKIYGSFGSSYSTAASHIGCVDLLLYNKGDIV